MSSRIGKAKLKTKDGRTVIELPKPRMAVGQRRNAEGKAKREAKAWTAKSRPQS